MKLPRLSPAALAGIALFSGASPMMPGVLSPAFAQEPVESSVLPGGASSIQEVYQDWQVTCVQQAQAKRCALSQQQLDQQSRQRVLAIEVIPVEDRAEGVLLLPFGLNLERGVTLAIDDGAPLPALRFRTCRASGCIAPISFEAEQIATLRAGTTLEVSVAADGGAETAFSVSLRGFSAALDRTLVLTQ